MSKLKEGILALLEDGVDLVGMNGDIQTDTTLVLVEQLLNLLLSDSTRQRTQVHSSLHSLRILDFNKLGQVEHQTLWSLLVEQDGNLTSGWYTQEVASKSNIFQCALLVIDDGIGQPQASLVINMIMLESNSGQC
ncbi:hypothetical protein D3C80_1734060 [compost metagenome]